MNTQNADQKRQTSDRFGKHAEGYATSAGHAHGPDLAILLHLLHAQSSWRVLDVATGAGHTAAAVAPHVAEVIASDLSPGMVAQAKKGFVAKGLDNVVAVERDVEDLQFADESFDAVTSRIAPHHFIDIDKAVSEIARVLKPGGVFVLEDNIAPVNKDLDNFINELEKQRDPTHVRSYTKDEWKEMLAKHGLTVVRARIYNKIHDIEDWIGRTDLTQDEQNALYDAFARAPQRAKKHFKVEFGEDGRAVRFTDDKVILKAIKKD